MQHAHRHWAQAACRSARILSTTTSRRERSLSSHSHLLCTLLKKITRNCRVRYRTAKGLWLNLPSLRGLCWARTHACTNRMVRKGWPASGAVLEPLFTAATCLGLILLLEQAGGLRLLESASAAFAGSKGVPGGARGFARDDLQSGLPGWGPGGALMQRACWRLGDLASVPVYAHLNPHTSHAMHHVCRCGTAATCRRSLRRRSWRRRRRIHGGGQPGVCYVCL